MKRFYLSVSLGLALLLAQVSAWGMSRLFDGEATGRQGCKPSQ